MDPDNRRPVDYELRRRLLAELDALSLTEVMERSDEGLPKLWTIRQALRLRNEHPEWFGREAEYEPVFARGPQAERVIAYLRGGKVLTVAQRWALRGNAWGKTSINIPEGTWYNRLTDEHIAHGGNWRAKDLFAKFPVALLVRLD